MRHLDFVLTLSLPRAGRLDAASTAKQSDGADYLMKYILLYTDDALVISENAERVLRLDLGSPYFETERGVNRSSQAVSW